MKPVIDTYIVILALSLLTAQLASADTASMRKLRISRYDNGMKLEITLTSPVTPQVGIAANPDRIVLDLPATVINSKQRRVAVNRNGVLRVRLGLNPTTPPMTRVVVDLDNQHPYQLTTSGNSIILMVLPATTMAHDAGANRNQSPRPTPAARGSMFGRLLPQQTIKPPLPAALTRPSDADLHVSFRVKYVAEGAAYLIGGRSSGLAEGMTLQVHEDQPGPANNPNPQGAVIAELRIVSVAETSSVTEIHNVTRDVKPGDWAELSPMDFARLGNVPTKTAGNNTMSPAIAVTPSVAPRVEQTPRDSRMMARINLDYSGITSSGSTPGHSGSIGLGFQTDMRQIAGTHWNLQGYWRGRFTTNSQPDEGTIEDYLDRTYIIQLFYANPDSQWVAGFGRLYLPWAASLDTIDGGYVGRKFGRHGTAGAFFGSTPNQATWNYRPDQQIAGSFVNFEGGDYDNFHYTSTTGFALSFVKWQLDRPYLFLENAVSYARYFSIYHSLIVDAPQGVSTDGITPGPGVSRSYLSVIVQPKRWVSLEIFHNYFRDVPTAATALVGTGMVDKLLYQGVNGTVRIEPVKHLSLYTTLGRSDKTGDLKTSLNQMYGITLSDIHHTGTRVDLHYSQFDSSFASGIYRIATISRPMGNRMMWNIQGGSQSLNSAFTVNQHSFFLDSSLDTNLSGHTFLQSGYTIERGAQLNYSQWHLSLGYRFDSRGSSQ